MYETKLFWKDKPSDLRNNWAIAKRRFDNLNLKTKDNNWLHNEYINIVKDQIKENIVKECSSHFETNSYYMPHTAVVEKIKKRRKFEWFLMHLRKGNASNYKQFASNRVIEIQSNSNPFDWHYCSGRENPADYVSCGVNLETIINNQFGMHGPQWLRKTKNNWPKNLNCGFPSTDMNPKNKCLHSHVN
ncbi:uncharacterized protein TNCV_2177441 [Trichonephila clavipes]|uniref:Uncharacterized protein n=1 Tax=Trichonephila clavipes TaxID=2585209 RepID=A0A8X6VU24_TRICX|nr:uncharacterized protein TNCV_2177441 [Trichonephila clavipes]